MKINPWMGAVAVLIVIMVGISSLQQNNTQTTPTPPPQPPAAKMDHKPPPGAKGKVVMLHSSDWEFTPSTIRFKQGETASLHLMGIEGDHGIAIPDLGINESMKRGENKLVSIPTDKPGTYDFFCSVPCGQGHKDMKGTIIIES